MDERMRRLEQRARSGDIDAQRALRTAQVRAGQSHEGIGVKVDKPIRYCAYWGHWSRILRKEGYLVVELDLTPINANWPGAWQGERSPANFMIRRHGTAPDRNDKFETKLPLGWVERMIKEMGEETTNRLLMFDFYPLIDWVKYDRVCNGGAPMDKIIKDGLRLPWWPWVINVHDREVAE